MLAAALLLPMPGQTKAAEPIVVQGPARVIDGDTLAVHGTRIRLQGIDAPEIRQRCEDGAGRPWACGRAATVALGALVGMAEVTCTARRRDRYRRLVAVCWAGGADIGRGMVTQGMAMAHRRFGRAYTPTELDARRAALGLWSGRFDMPWDWRKARRRVTARALMDGIAKPTRDTPSPSPIRQELHSTSPLLQRD